MPQLIEQRLRNSTKPECISAAALRAQARAPRSVGQTAAWSQARYSAMDNESHTTISPSIKLGTLPLGEILRYASQLGASPKAIKCSTNGI